jgi:hypothetical protein
MCDIPPNSHAVGIAKKYLALFFQDVGDNDFELPSNIGDHDQPLAMSIE